MKGHLLAAIVRLAEDISLVADVAVERLKCRCVNSCKSAYDRNLRDESVSLVGVEDQLFKPALEAENELLRVLTYRLGILDLRKGNASKSVIV